MRWRARGTRSWASSGSRPPGWRPACSSRPAVSGYEPKGQRLGVNFLFVCLLVIVVGSLAGEWLGVQQKLGFVANFWFGHQGYEYVDLGPVLADLPVRGAVRVALPDGPRVVAGAQESRSEPAPAGVVRHRLGGHRPVLRRGPDVGPADAPGHGRILALVGGASLGGRLL